MVENGNGGNCWDLLLQYKLRLVSGLLRVLIMDSGGDTRHGLEDLLLQYRSRLAEGIFLISSNWVEGSLSSLSS